MDHPVLIPTSEGPVGGIVSEPSGEARASMILLPGYGRPARSGVNSFWTRTARELADLGLVVLRFDYSREGETLPLGEDGPGGQLWKKDLDLALLAEIAPWFEDRTGPLPLMLIGSCAGGRLAIEFAGRRPDAIAAMFLVVPYVSALVDPESSDEAATGGDASVDPKVVDWLRASLDGTLTWMLVGEQDSVDIAGLERSLGSATHRLEVDLVPTTALHMLDQPNLQAQAGTRLIERVSRFLGRPAALQGSH